MLGIFKPLVDTVQVTKYLKLNETWLKWPFIQTIKNLKLLKTAMPDLLKIKKFLELQGCTQTIGNLKWFKIAMPNLMKNKTFLELTGC